MTANDRPAIGTVIARARDQLQSLTGRPLEAVTAVEREEAGWRLTIEVVELRRIPDSTSILGCYEVRVDRNGTLMDYARTARYARNHAEDGEA